MNRERHRYWTAYIADVQGRMLLTDWRIDLCREPPSNPDAAATVDALPGRRDALVRLHEGFDRYTRAFQRHAVVHELVHLHLWPLKYHLEVQNGDRDDEVDSRERIYRGHTSHEEFAVDDLARIIAPRMPLPPKVKP